MQTKRFLTGFAIAAMTTVMLSGCFGSPTKSTVTPKPASSHGVTVTDQNGSTPSTPQPKSTFVPTQDPNAPAGYADYAASLYPNVKGTDSYTKAQVQAALYSAYMYSQQSANNAYFISGEWARSDYSQSAVTQYFGNWFTQDAKEQLLADVSVIKTDVKSGQAVFGAFNFLPDGGKNYTVCARNAVTCQVKGYPKIDGDVSYRETDQKRILVQMTVESRIVMTIDGTKGYLPVTNKMTLYMVPNDSYKGQAGTYPFLIDGWSNDVDRPGFSS